MRKRPPDTREAGLRPARGAEVGLLFLAQEDAEERRGEERRGGGTRLKSNNPNTEGGEQKSGKSVGKNKSRAKKTKAANKKKRKAQKKKTEVGKITKLPLTVGKLNMLVRPIFVQLPNVWVTAVNCLQCAVAVEVRFGAVDEPSVLVAFSTSLWTWFVSSEKDAF